MPKAYNDNIALLIDADNASHAGIDPVLTALAELGIVNIRRAYGNWRKQALKGWVDILHKYGIEPQQQFDITKGKNATDMKMTIDAMDLVFRGNVTGFGIMSSDSDFMPLAMRIRQEGIPVYGFGSAKTPDGFKQACSRFIDVDALIKADKRGQGKNGSQASQKSDKNNDNSASKNDDHNPAVEEELLKLLIDAYQASKRDAEGYASLSEVGKIAGNRSSFDVRNYGFSRLSDMFEEVPNFQTKRDDKGQLYVKRLR
ncbi:NYN domain-containing protein [Parasphingorhabdus sp. JC815]|uniref:NYN domain-containing protein n=1 Tax=Parasphingorhabdus sp. JC815 TaxID=3232140 RepID=UPI003459D91E